MNSPSILLQRPHKWTDLHLEVGRIRATNGMTAKQILGAKYMPADGEPEFERVARPLCEFDFGQIQRAEYTENEDNPFSMIFNDLLTMLQPDGMTPLISGNLIRDLMNQIVSRTKARGRFCQMIQSHAHYNIPQLNIRGKLPGSRTIVARNERKRHTLSAPLITLSVVENNHAHVSALAQYIAPHGVLGATLAYSGNPQLRNYDQFVICIEGPIIIVGRIRASRDYMCGFVEHQAIDEDLPLYCSAPFNLFSCDDRREFTRMVIGIFRYLDESEQSNVFGDYGKNWF